MATLQTLLNDLPFETREQLEQEAAARGMQPLDYVAELVTADLHRQQPGLRNEASHYRFANEHDFDVDTLRVWLARHEDAPTR